MIHYIFLIACQILFPIYNHPPVAAYYRSLTVDHFRVGTADTADYPLLFLGNASLATVANGGRVTSSSGYDIIFCTSPTSHAACLGSILPFERVSWSASTGLGEFWIQIPDLSHTVDTVIYVYYGDPSITTDQENVNGTWDANFGAVWHFGTPSSLVLTDSTVNANNGTNTGAVAGTGEISGAASFSGSQYVDFGGASSINFTGDYSVEAWLASSAPATNIPLGISDGVGAVYMQAGAGSPAVMRVVTFGLGSFINANTNNINLSTPQYVFSTYAGAGGGLMQTYDNGNFFDNNSGTNKHTSSVATWHVGAFKQGTGGTVQLFWTGIVDEVRISNIARAPSYQLANYNNAANYSLFLTVGSEVHI